MGFFVYRHLGLVIRNIAIMKRFLPLLILNGLLFGQDVLTHKSGKIYKGKYFGIVEQNIVFYVEGETGNKMFPIREVTSIELESTKPIVTDFDILILKSGTTYFGEYSKIEGEIVYFKPQNVFAFQPISIKQIQTLKLKDGQFIIGSSSDILTYEEYQKKLTVKEKAIDVLKTVSGKEYKGKYLKTEGGKVFFIPEGANSPLQVVPVKLIKKLQLKDGHFIILDGRNRLALEEYQKLSAKEKAIYDANLYNVFYWALYGSISGIIFSGYNEVMHWWRGDPFISKGSLALAASLTIPYFVLNNNVKINFPKSILTDSEKEIYEQAYSKKLQKRKFKYTVGSFIGAGVAVYFMSKNSNSGFSMSGYDAYLP